MRLRKAKQTKIKQCKFKCSLCSKIIIVQTSRRRASVRSENISKVCIVISRKIKNKDNKLKKTMRQSS